MIIRSILNKNTPNLLCLLLDIFSHSIIMQWKEKVRHISNPFKVTQKRDQEDLLIDHIPLNYQYNEYSCSIEYREVETNALVQISYQDGQLRLYREVKDEMVSQGLFAENEVTWFVIKTVSGTLQFEVKTHFIEVDANHLVFQFDMLSQNERLHTNEFKIEKIRMDSQ